MSRVQTETGSGEEQTPHRSTPRTIHRPMANGQAQAIRLDGNRSTNCGSTEKLEGHHIRPLAKGGAAYSLDNIITLCASCHQQKDSARKPDRPVQAPVAPILVAQRPAKHRFSGRVGAEPEDE